MSQRLADASKLCCSAITEAFPDAQLQLIPTVDPQTQRSTVNIDVWFDLEHGSEDLKAKHRAVSDYLRDNLPAAARSYRRFIKFSYRGRVPAPLAGNPSKLSSQRRAEMAVERWALMRAGGRLKSTKPDGLDSGGGEEGTDLAIKDFRMVQSAINAVLMPDLVGDILEQLHHEKRSVHAFRANGRYLRSTVAEILHTVQQMIEEERRIKTTRVEVLEEFSPAVETTFKKG